MSKVRLDFITNSSSSSFVVIYEVENNKTLKDYLKEEFGKYGLKLAGTYIELGKDIKEKKYHDVKDYLEDDQIDDNKHYLSANFIEWTNEGDSEGNDAWLAKHIPSEFIKEIYNGGEQ